MTDATLRRLINSGGGYNIARAWLGYKATSELKLKAAEPLSKINEANILQAGYSLDAYGREELQKAFDTYDALRYNNQLAMAQLQHAGRRCEELKRRIDLAWMFETLKPESYVVTRDYNSPARYSFDNYWFPMSIDHKELFDDAHFFYNCMINSLNFVKAYNAAAEIAAKYYKIPEISENWAQYDPTEEITTEYRKSRGRLIQRYTEQLPPSTVQQRLKTLRSCFPEIKFGLIDIPEYKTKEGLKLFTDISVSISEIIGHLNISK